MARRTFPWQARCGLAAVLAAAALCFANRAEARPNYGPLMGLEAVEGPLPWFDAEENYEQYAGRRQAEADPLHHISQGATEPTFAVTVDGFPHMPDGARLLLSRSVYPAEDGHLDAILWLDASRTWRRGEGDGTPEGRLRFLMLSDQGDVVAEETVEPIPASRLFFSFAFPGNFAGSGGRLHAEWRDTEGVLAGQAEQPFRVRTPQDAPRSGRIRLTMPNEGGVRMAGVPVTVGVPFPQGSLDSLDNLRLVDAEGREVPVQLKETGRWSRFGGVRWVLCDFVADLDGAPREFFLEFGPEVRREEVEPLALELRDGFPGLDLEALRVGDGVWFVPKPGAAPVRLVEEKALAGGFVEHVRDYDFSGFAYIRMRMRYGRVGLPEQYAVPLRSEYRIEETGPVKTVVRREGWYRKPDGSEFCQYVIRYVMHRGSPVLRVFYTWVFTGDSNRDRISNMGWRVPLAKGMRPKGILSGFGEGGEWLQADYLLQHRHDAYSAEREELHRQRSPQVVAKGRRAPGVMAAESGKARLYFGVKDFWQNYPGELEFEQGGRSMAFHLWPRHGRESRERVSVENAFRLHFAHEGEVMDLRVPRELTEGSMFRSANLVESNWAYGMPESVNAQGVAKTTEMWLYATGADAAPEEATKALEGLNDETLRVVVDPRWMVGSEVFFEMHPHDPESFPQEEEAYRLQALNIPAQVERLGVYGMWIYGDLVRSADLEERTSTDLYRLFRKGHWGWPYRWVPFYRSGDLAYFKFAEAATRMMSDVAFVHYVGDDVRRQFEEMPPRMAGWRVQPWRKRGWHNRNLIPWAGFHGPSTTGYADEADYLWDAWHLTGYHRGRDVALAWADALKEEKGPLFVKIHTRPAVTAQRQYVLMYQNTFDPWFLAAFHALAEMSVERHRQEGWGGHPWSSGPREFQRYAGCPDHEKFYLHYARQQADWQRVGWATTPSTLLESSAFAYRLTGEEIFLRRALGVLDLFNWSTYREGPDYYCGFAVRRGTHDHLKEAGWYLQWIPFALRLKQEARTVLGELPPPLPLAFAQGGARGIVFHVRKEEGQPLPIRVRGRFSVEDEAGEKVALEDDLTFGHYVGQGLPAHAPAGTYRVRMDSGSTTVPITPPGSKEVMEVANGTVGSSGGHYVQHWFKVPEGLADFEIEFENRPPPQPGYQITILNPDGEPAWAFRRLACEHDPDERIVARVDVPSAHAGKLWRITNPGRRSGVPGFRLDKRLPPVVAHCPDRWFDIGR